MDNFKVVENCNDCIHCEVCSKQNAYINDIALLKASLTNKSEVVAVIKVYCPFFDKKQSIFKEGLK